MQYSELSKEQLNTELAILNEKFSKIKELGLKLDMSRGKPEAKQLDLSMGLLDISETCSRDGIDARNYGNLEGIPEGREFFADLMECSAENVIVGGNSSLNLMYIVFEIWWRKGFDGCPALSTLDKVKVICPSPGYDRHFTITEHFGVEMITVAMTEDGPDMDEVEALVSSDDSIKGIWCIPQYSNPQGFVYSDETVERLSNMKTAATDFKILWDNAYCVHHLIDNPIEVKPLLVEARKSGNEDRVFMFCSTSKITFAGAGVGAIGASNENISYILKNMNPMTISFDKMNQLRHVLFLKDKKTVLQHMKKHAKIMNPKFELCAKYFTEELKECGKLIDFTDPKGGYFINFEAMPGTAKRCVELCKEAGVILTPAGASYPYGLDPKDTHIRIAPTFPPLSELDQALQVFTLAVKIATVQKLLVQ